MKKLIVKKVEKRTNSICGHTVVKTTYDSPNSEYSLVSEVGIECSICNSLKRPKRQIKSKIIESKKNKTQN